VVVLAREGWGGCCGCGCGMLGLLACSCDVGDLELGVVGWAGLTALVG
jgi:hypothetical protein